MLAAGSAGLTLAFPERGFAYFKGGHTPIGLSQVTISRLPFTDRQWLFKQGTLTG